MGGKYYVLLKFVKVISMLFALKSESPISWSGTKTCEINSQSTASCSCWFG